MTKDKRRPRWLNPRLTFLSGRSWKKSLLKRAGKFGARNRNGSDLPTAVRGFSQLAQSKGNLLRRVERACYIR